MGFALTLTLSRSGISCFLPALVLVILFAREVRRRFREGRDDRTGYWIRLGAVTGLVAIAFQAARGGRAGVKGVRDRSGPKPVARPRALNTSGDVTPARVEPPPIGQSWQ